MISGILSILLVVSFIGVIASLFTMLMQGECPIFLTGSVIMLVCALLISFGWIIILLVRTWPNAF